MDRGDFTLIMKGWRAYPSRYAEGHHMRVYIKGIIVTVSGGTVGMPSEKLPDGFFELVCNVLKGWNDAGYTESMSLQEFIDRLGLRDP